MTREVYLIGRLSVQSVQPSNGRSLRVVHKLFKDLYSCARSFSLLPLLVLL